MITYTLRIDQRRPIAFVFEARDDVDASMLAGCFISFHIDDLELDAPLSLKRMTDVESVRYYASVLKAYTEHRLSTLKDDPSLR